MVPRAVAFTIVWPEGVIFGSRPGPHLDQNVLARVVLPERAIESHYATVALASILDPSGGLFSDAARPCQRPAPPFGANVALENRD